MTCERARTATPALAALAVLLALAAGPAAGSDGAYPETPHGDPADGVLRLAGIDRAECAHCHDQHASRDGVPTAGPFPWLLFTVNDNTLCSEAGGVGGCHAVAGDDRIYPDILTYEQSAHATSGVAVWPGPDPPARPGTDSGYCVNCHDPHGVRDATGVIPSQVFGREEALCLECHDFSGPAAEDVEADFQRLYRHPAPDVGGLHDESEGGNPLAFADGNRHAECVDCHNPHRARQDLVPPSAPAASNRLLGVSRVQVTNGPAGTTPSYTFRPADDLGPANEYELCFKCHSSWTTQPGGQEDLAVRFNPNNPSHHAVEAPGADPTIDPGSFVAGHGPTEVLYCSDCHNSGEAPPGGPHGSDNPFLLAGGWVASPASRVMSPDEICFQCHRFEVYADRNSSDSVLGLSRFNPPAQRGGHATHVDRREYPCYACHESHGSTSKAKLIATSRAEGLTDWIMQPDGGTCSSTCHRDRTYAINYPR